MPILASNLFPGVTAREVPTKCHPTFGGHASIPPPCSVPSLIDLQGTDWWLPGKQKLQFSGKAAQWHAYTIWSSLCSFPIINN